jgi:His-Xaa-Ser repeat protein HxsA
MKRRSFLIPTLVAAGFTVPAKGMVVPQGLSPLANSEPDSGTLLKLFKQDHAVVLADHRSHSSHSSHRSSSGGGGGGGHYSHTSHASHRSSAGGAYEYPAPAYVPPSIPAPAPRAQPQRPAPLIGSYGQGNSSSNTTQYAAPAQPTRTLSGRTNQFKAIVKRVQIALLARDLYVGAIDGEVGPALRSAIRQFQTAQNMSVTGTITPEVLDGLRVSTDD